MHFAVETEDSFNIPAMLLPETIRLQLKRAVLDKSFYERTVLSSLDNADGCIGDLEA